MNRSAILLVPCVVLLCSLLSGCGKSAPDDDEAATPAGEVAVTGDVVDALSTTSMTPPAKEISGDDLNAQTYRRRPRYAARIVGMPLTSI